MMEVAKEWDTSFPLRVSHVQHQSSILQGSDHNGGYFWKYI